jgi:hypothetical protein
MDDQWTGNNFSLGLSFLNHDHGLVSCFFTNYLLKTSVFLGISFAA